MNIRLAESLTLRKLQLCVCDLSLCSENYRRTRSYLRCKPTKQSLGAWFSVFKNQTLLRITSGFSCMKARATRHVSSKRSSCQQKVLTLLESSLKEVILFRGCAVEFFAVSLFYEIDFFQWRASLKLGKLISNSSLNLRKRLYLKANCFLLCNTLKKQFC